MDGSQMRERIIIHHHHNHHHNGRILAWCSPAMVCGPARRQRPMLRFGGHAMGFIRLKEILPGALEGLGIAERLHQDRIERAWPTIAGTISRELAAGSSVVMLRD